VQRGPSGAYLYVIKPDDTAARRLVQVGHEDEQTSIIADGVAPGERVVIDGASRLTDGAKVSLVSPQNAPVLPGEGASPAAHPHKKPQGSSQGSSG
jgi:multidrug efflux system membrane fusion protein